MCRLWRTNPGCQPLHIASFRASGAEGTVGWVERNHGVIRVASSSGGWLARYWAEEGGIPQAVGEERRWCGDRYVSKGRSSCRARGSCRCRWLVYGVVSWHWTHPSPSSEACFSHSTSPFHAMSTLSRVWRRWGHVSRYIARSTDPECSQIRAKQRPSLRTGFLLVHGCCPRLSHLGSR